MATSRTTNIPPGHKAIVRTIAITDNFEKTDPQKSVGDNEGTFIKDDGGVTRFGVGTDIPFSRISLGNIRNTLEVSDAAIALTEDISGHYSSGLAFYDQTTKYGIKFCVNKLESVVDVTQTKLSYTPISWASAPILTLENRVQERDDENFENGNAALTGKRVYINCIEPIRAEEPQRSGLDVNGMITLSDKLNFFKTSIEESVPIGGAVTERAIALRHIQADGTFKEFLTREGHNRVVDASNTLISVLPDSYTNGPRVNYSTDPSGIFMFRNCDFVIGNGEMAVVQQLAGTSQIKSDTSEYWNEFKNISTSFINARGNAIISHINDISNVQILSKAYENVDYSRNGVLYLQNNLGIGSRQPEAVIDCNKIDLPFFKMGKDIVGISNNSIAIGSNLNVTDASYSFIFGKENSLFIDGLTFSKKFNFLFGDNITVKNTIKQFDYNLLFGTDIDAQGNHNIVFGNDHRLNADVSYCTLLGFEGKIDSSGNDSAIMKYTLGENNDIFMLKRNGTLWVKKDISGVDAYLHNRLYAKYIGEEGRDVSNAHITDLSGRNIEITNHFKCKDISADIIEAPTFHTDKIYANEVIASENSIFLGDKKTLFVETNGNIKTLDIAGTNNMLFNVNNSNVMFLNEDGNLSIGNDNRTTSGSKLYVKDINGTITNTNLIEGLEFGKNTSNDYHLRLATNGSEKVSVDFGNNNTANKGKIEYDNNDSTFNVYYDSEYHIYKDTNKIISLTNTGMEINTPLTLTQEVLTTKFFKVSNGGEILFENSFPTGAEIKYLSNLLNINSVNIKNTYSTEFTIYNSGTEQIKLNSSEFLIKIPTKINNNIDITGELKIGDLNVGRELQKSAGATAWSANNNGLYVDRKIAINYEQGNLLDKSKPFDQFYPSFDLDVSGNARIKNLLLGEFKLNIMPFSMSNTHTHISNKNYYDGHYEIHYNKPTKNEVWHLFDNNDTTFWESKNTFVDGSSNEFAINVQESVSTYNSISNTYNINNTNIDLDGERIDIILPMNWTLKYYGFKPPLISSGLNDNMPSKWRLIANNDAGWKSISKKDFSNNNIFQEDKFYYFNLDLDNNFSLDNYYKFSFVIEGIFNKGIDISCNIGEIKLFGEMNDLPVLNYNLVQSQIQNNGIEYNDVSNVNNNTSKPLVLQPFGEKIGIYNVEPKVILDISSNDALRIPVGGNNWKINKVNSDFKGCIRYNTDDGQFEGCDGINWGGLGGVISLDQKTKIVADNDDGITFVSHDVSSIIVDESGKVGVGTMAPSVIFDISSSDAMRVPAGSNSDIATISFSKPGYIRYNTDTTQFEGYDGANWGGLGGVISLDQKTKIIADNDDGITFVSHDVSSIIVDESGKVGVGTMAPSVIFDISSSDAMRVPAGSNSDIATISFSKPGYIRYNTDTTQFEGYDGANWGGLGGVISLDQKTKIVADNDDGITFVSHDVSSVFITENGNFGIGIIPTSKFEVNGDISANSIEIHDGSVNFSHAISVVAPTTPLDLSSNNVATTAFVQDRIKQKIDNLINGAPAALDTLNELAIALDNDANFNSTVVSLINQKQDPFTASNRLNPAFIDTGDIGIALTNTDIQRLSGVTSNIQTQINANVSSITDLETSTAGLTSSLSDLTTNTLPLKANLNNANFTGTVTINSASVATESYVISNIASSLSTFDSGVWNNETTYIHYSNNVTIGATSSTLNPPAMPDNTLNFGTTSTSQSIAPLSIIHSDATFKTTLVKGLHMGIYNNNNAKMQFVSASGQQSNIDFKVVGGTHTNYDGRISYDVTSVDLAGGDNAGFKFYTNNTLRCQIHRTTGLFIIGSGAYNYNVLANVLGYKCYIDGGLYSTGGIAVSNDSTFGSYNSGVYGAARLGVEGKICATGVIKGDSGEFTKITLTADPTQDMEVATKQYVDNNGGGGGGGGGSGSGIFTVSGNNAYYLTGNIGIGTMNPTHALDVVGEIHATGNIVSFTTSDRKLKNNLMPIEEPLEKLKKINGYTFEWVKENSVHSFEGKDIGVIAQEVEEILPEVTVTREDGYKAVRYEKMVPFLISCIKEQQKQIDELRELLKK